MKYKVGDTVKIVGKAHYYHGFDIGDIGEIVSFDGERYYFVRVGSLKQTIHEKNLELVEPTDKKPTFKVGDKVRILKKKKYPYTGTFGDHIGETGLIHQIQGDGTLVINGLPDWKTGQYFGFYGQDEVELVADEKPRFVPPFYVNCPTEEIWKKVIKRSIELGYKDNFIHEWHEGYFVCVNRYGINTWCASCEGNGTGKKIDYHDFLGIPRETDKLTVDDVKRAVEELDKNDEFYGKGIGEQINEAYKKMLERSEEYADAIRYGMWPTYYSCDFANGSSITFTNSPKSGVAKIMETLKEIPNRLKRALNANLRNFYKLDWIDGDLDVTEEGEEALKNFLFDKFEEELGAVAAKEVAERKKKKKDED